MASAAEQMAANLSWGTFGKAKDLQSRILFALGLLIHVLAAFLGRAAARRRRPEIVQVEADLVLLAGVAIPLFGPLAGWALPRPPKTEEPDNAHEVFAKYERRGGVEG